jgi:Kef-type K+ transport system membrane component KefB
MIHTEHTLSLVVLLVGLIIISALLLKNGLKRLRIPGLVGFMALGFLLNLLDQKWSFMSADAEAIFSFLSSVGVIALLFRIGLESNLAGMIRQLPRAGFVWAGDIMVSGLAGFATAKWILGMELIPSLFAGVSLTATSVGVSMAVWREKKALKSKNGELLIDVAELDDISGIGLMAILFAIVPVLQSQGSSGDLFLDVAKTAGWFLLKLLGFTIFCLIFAKYAEQPLYKLFKKTKRPESTMLMVTGTGFVIAALAGWLGFSLAIGALFAGLLFSRDPDSIKLDTSFESLYEMFTPFFFLGIGLNIDPGSIANGLGVGAVLVIVAILGKTIGAGGPAFLLNGPLGTLLIGVSMIPRAEISMIIMQRGQQLGEWAVPPRLFSGMVFVSAVTCVLIPWILSYVLQYQQEKQE